MTSEVFEAAVDIVSERVYGMAKITVDNVKGGSRVPKLQRTGGNGVWWNAKAHAPFGLQW